jgi:hypothetical protein
MAIQISGTEVISNSRGLNNIASIDATTAASISAAGVGGGGTIDFTADGAISAGDVVVLNSDGTVSAVSETTTSASDGSSNAIGGSIYNYHSTACYDANSGNVVGAYQDNGSRVYCAVGTVGTGNTVTWGTQLQVDTSSSTPSLVSIGGGKVVLTYSKSYQGYARVGTVSGTGISFGTAYQFTSYAGNSRCPVTYDANADKIVVMANMTGTDKAVKVGSISGTALSFGSAVVINSRSLENYDQVAYDPVSQKIAIVAQSSTSAVSSYVGTVSGTSITLGSANSFNPREAGSIRNGALLYDPTSQKILFSYSDYNNSNYATTKVGSISGTTLSFGTGTVWRSASSSNITSVEFTNAGKVAFFAGGYYIGGTVGSTSVTFDSTLNYVGNTVGQPGLAYVPAKNKVVANGSNGLFHGVEVFNIEYSSSDNDSWIGISTQAISDTASGSITVLGGVNDQQTGLTIGTTYYADTDGTLTATANNYKVGKAIAATDLLITEVNT